MDREKAVKILYGIARNRGVEEVLGELGVCWEVYVDWRVKREAFDRGVLRARKIAAELMVDRMLSELDAAKSGDGERERISLLRLKSETFRWVAERTAPEVYGEKSEVSARLSLNRERPVVEVIGGDVRGLEMVKSDGMVNLSR